MPDNLEVFGPHNSDLFSRDALTKWRGPGNPVYHIVENLCVQDVVSVYDDFTTALNTDYWTATESGAGTTFARLANTLSGVIRGTTATTSGNDQRLFATNNEHVVTNARPVLLTRVRQPTTITLSKFEVGFADAVAAGQVNVKATPTSTGTDYAVIIRDTNDNTDVDLITDGTTPAVAAVTGNVALTAWAVDTFFTLMLALDEENDARFWLNGIYGGVLATGPDDNTTLAPWFYVQTRTTAARSFDIDYVKIWHERTTI